MRLILISLIALVLSVLSFSALAYSLQDLQPNVSRYVLSVNGH
jgi:hypothetical protein